MHNPARRASSALAGTGDRPQVWQVSNGRVRRAGMLVPVWSLRRDGTQGIGDTTAVRELVDWAAECGLGFLQLLPINETGVDHSPYNAISSVALEPSLLDLALIPQLNSDDFVRARGEVSPEVFTRNLVDYPAVKKLKRGLLEVAFGRFWSEERESEQGAAFTSFCKEESGWLDLYCKFRWLMTLEGNCETWDLWSMNYNTAQKAEAWIAEKRAARSAEIERCLAFPAWIQWIAYTQWRDLRAYAGSRDVKLMGDVPIGISFSSADVFFEGQWFDLQWSGGAPPETVFKDDAFAVRWGQNWGIPLYRWDVLREDNFSWWRRRIEKLTEVFQIFRIDHILGFYRIFSFPWRPGRNAEFLTLDPEEAKARTGGRLPGFKPHDDDTPEHRAANLAEGDEYLRMVLEAAGDNKVVGEDLGAVPDYVRPHLLAIGIGGFKICHWEVGEDGVGIEHPIPGTDYEECSFATFATHDHPPMALMWEGYRSGMETIDEDAREGARWNLRVLSEFAGIPLAKDADAFPPYDEELQWKLLTALFETNSRYAAFMITDLFGMTERFNVPATVGGANWAVRMPFTVEEMGRRDDLKNEAEKLSILIHDTRR